MSEWWFNAVSATEAIFTRTCYSKSYMEWKKKEEKQTTHKSLKRESNRSQGAEEKIQISKRENRPNMYIPCGPSYYHRILIAMNTTR